jgi:hypothetical protein
MSEYRQLELTDMQVQACSRWRDPAGREFLELFHVIPFFQAVPANAPIMVDVELGVPTEFDFLCKAIGYTGQTAGTLIQIQWPDGRYLSQAGVDVFNFIQTGKRGRLVSPEKELERGSKIRMNIDNSAVGSVSNVELYFEGLLRIPMLRTTKGSNGANCILG